MKQVVQNWLQSGCIPEDGIRLLEKYSGNLLLIRLIKSNPVKNIRLLTDSLCKLAGINYLLPTTNYRLPTTYSKPPKQTTFRDEFPFLSTPDCPFELKALVTDKFSSFYRYRTLHSELSGCTTLEQCAATAGELISSYRENRAIYAELNYYKQHHSILGKHPIFKHFNHLKDLKAMNIRELIEKERKLLHNIWRIETEIAKGDKPALLADRKQRLELKQNELAEVRRLLN